MACPLTWVHEAELDASPVRLIQKSAQVGRQLRLGVRRPASLGHVVRAPHFFEQAVVCMWWLECGIRPKMSMHGVA